MHELEFVQSSVTVCVRWMVPPHTPPTRGAVEQLYDRLASQLSDADAPLSASKPAKVIGQSGTFASHSTVMLIGHVMEGGVLSMTVTTLLQVLVQPLAPVITNVKV
jgi:hypothetical protein